MTRKILEIVKTKPSTAHELIHAIARDKNGQYRDQAVYRALCDMKKKGLLSAEKVAGISGPFGTNKVLRYSWSGVEPLSTNFGTSQKEPLPDQPKWLFHIPGWRRKKLTLEKSARELRAFGFSVSEPSD